MSCTFPCRSRRLRRVLALGLCAVATGLIHGCEGTEANKSAPTTLPPEQAQANKNMMDFVKNKAEPKK